MSLQSRETELFQFPSSLPTREMIKMNYFLVHVSVALLKLLVLNHFKETIPLV